MAGSGGAGAGQTLGEKAPEAGTQQRAGRARQQGPGRRTGADTGLAPSVWSGIRLGDPP